MPVHDLTTSFEPAGDASVRFTPAESPTPNSLRSLGRMTMLDGHLLEPFVHYFLDDVVEDRNLTVNTQRSYRDSTHVFLRFLRDHHALEPSRVTVEQITAAVVRDFLAHLEQQRGNSVSTRNQRLKAIHALFHLVARKTPELAEHVRQIHDIPLRRSETPTLAYLDRLEIEALLAVPDRRHAQGRRDYALLLFLYNTGARASEAAELTIDALSLDSLSGSAPGPLPGSPSTSSSSAPGSVRLRRGQRTRECPLWPHTVDILRQLLGARLQGPGDAAVFHNVRNKPITRFGIHTLVARTAARAAQQMPSLHNKRVSPHTIRHTTAVHLLRAGVNIDSVRSWLGHVSAETTNRYAEINAAAAAPGAADTEQPAAGDPLAFVALV